MFHGVGLSATVSTHPLLCSKMESDSESQAKLQELERQVAALKKENTKLKNEMRFNLEQEKFVQLLFLVDEVDSALLCFDHL